MRVLMTICLLIAALMSAALADDVETGTGDVDLRVEAISKTLRCVVCQNQSINDSEAPLAIDMKQLVRTRVEAGDSDAEVRDYIRERYGDFVLMTPPVQSNTLVLWLGPLALLAVAIGWFVIRLRADERDGAAAGPDEDQLVAARKALYGDQGRDA